MRLKHMVKDKINYRARGPNTSLTRQPVQGRANDGGLRIGEMERDGVLAHGMSYFLNESFLVRGDEYYIAVCNKSGAIAIYNEAKNLFLSPLADGPIDFFTNPDATLNIKNLSKFGRSFSILRVPYSLKLLIQELQVMNIQMRIITDENVDQLLSMSYSDNINKLLNETGDLKQANEKYNSIITKMVYNVKPKSRIIDEVEVTPEEVSIEMPRQEPQSPTYATASPAYMPEDQLNTYTGTATVAASNSSQFNPDRNQNSQPESPPYAPGSPAYVPQEQLNTYTANATASNSSQYNPNESPQPTQTILEVQQPEQTETVSATETATDNQPNNDSTSKKIVIQTPEDSTSTNKSNETKKIIL
jgi:hypothetical protein